MRGPGKKSSDGLQISGSWCFFCLKRSTWFWKLCNDILMSLVIASTWSVGQGRVLDTISSPKYALLDSFSFCFQSFSGTAHNLVRGVQVKIRLAYKSSDRKEVAFHIHWTFEILMMIELDVLDESQQAVTLATGSHWRRYLMSYSKMAMYLSCLVWLSYMPCSLSFLSASPLLFRVQESFSRSC